MAAQNNYLKRTEKKSIEVVGSVNRKIDGIAATLTEKYAAAGGDAGIQIALDGLKKKASKKVGKIIYDEDGKVQKVKRFYGTHCQQTIDGAAQITEWAVGDTLQKAVGALNALQQEANFLQQKTDQASAALLGPLHQIESGLIAATTSSVGHQVGTKFAGMTFGAAVSIQFNPGTCGDLGKAVKDLLKLIGIVQKLIGKLKLAQIVPGLKKLLKQVNKLGKIALPCVDITGQASASIDSFNLPGVEAPTATDPISWGLVPEPAAQQDTQ